MFAASSLPWLLTACAHITVVITALVVIPRDRKPTAAMAWILLIALLPGAGIALFLLIGSARLPAARRAEQDRIDGIIRSRTSGATRIADRDVPRWFDRVLHQNETLTALPASIGNSATLYGDYERSIDVAADAIDAAQHFVNVEFFIVALDDTTRGFFAAMERAVARGVDVRLLADFIATRKIPGSKATMAEPDRIGVEWAWMLPVQPLRGKYQRPDLRNHRKIVVVDGEVAFVGSQNLIDRSYDSPRNLSRGLKWQELVTEVRGPAVASINAVFLSDWLIETGQDLSGIAATAPPDAISAAGSLLCQVVPSGPGYATENNLRLFLSLIHGATERVILTSPYFVPDEAMVYAITTACQRGVEVHLIVSEIGDQFMVWHAQRSYYSTLLEAGCASSSTRRLSSFTRSTSP